MDEKNKLSTEESKSNEKGKRNSYILLPVIFIYVIIYSFFNIYANMVQLLNWKLVIFSLMMQMHNYLVGYVITDFLPIKRNWVKILIMILIATLIDSVTEFEYVNECTTLQLVMFFISCVVVATSYFNLKYYKFINDRYIENMNSDKKYRMQTFHLVYTIILCCLMLVALVYIVIVFIINHDIFAVNITWG